MSHKRFVTLVVGACIVCVVLHRPADTFGWGAFAHWHGAPASMKLCVNLPDMWDSWSFIRDWPTGGEVNREFGWGHACLRTGVHSETVYGLTGYIPNTPTKYTEESLQGAQGLLERPGYDMYKLVGKMTPAHRTAENDSAMVTTARGWAAHNLMDLVVHFDYFLGGTFTNWYDHHKHKEFWADVILYNDACNGVFDSYDPNCLATAHTGIILLAEKCFRKNRQTIDLVPGTSQHLEAPPVVPLAALNDKLDELNTELQGLRYSQHDYDEAVDDETEFLWNRTTLRNRHATAEVAALSVIYDMPYYD